VFMEYLKLHSSFFHYTRMHCYLLVTSDGEHQRRVFPTSIKKPHLNWKSAQEVIGFQSYGKPNFKNFKNPKIPNLGIPRQNDIWV